MLVVQKVDVRGLWPGEVKDRKLTLGEHKRFVARTGRKSEKWHLSRNESTDSSRRYGQKSTKMGCVRGARDEFTDSSRSFGQKSGKWHSSRNESADSSRAKGPKFEKRHLARDESTDSSRRLGQNSTKMGCVRGARNKSTDSSRSFGQKSENGHIRCTQSADSVQAWSKMGKVPHGGHPRGEMQCLDHQERKPPAGRLILLETLTPISLPSPP
jgi:hypothetical protein